MIVLEDKTASITSIAGRLFGLAAIMYVEAFKTDITAFILTS